MPGTPRPTSDLWRDYKTSPTLEVRNELIERYRHLITYQAERIHPRLPEEVELDDLKSAGVFGLMEAIEGFDPDRGVKFDTYCAPRIRGAILDELRAMDWVPRQTRGRGAKVEKVAHAVLVETGKPAAPDQIQKRLGLTDREFAMVARDCSPPEIKSLAAKWYETTEDGKEFCTVDALVDNSVPDPSRKSELEDFMAVCCRGLQRAEWSIIYLYYIVGMTMKEIGHGLDLSESRVSQIHGAILPRIRDAVVRNRMAAA